MKRIKVLLIVGLIMALLITGCGLSGNKSNNAGNSNVEDNKDQDNDDNNDESDNSAEQGSEEIYAAFLNGEKSAVAGDNVNGLTKDKEYTIDDMSASFNIEAEWYVVINKLDKIQYGIIDAGNDGEPELAVKFVYTNGDKTDFAEVMVILKNYSGTIKALLRTDTYYRTASTILTNGIVTYGGSNSAFEHSMEYRAIDKDGNVNYVCGIDSVYGLSKCIIPAGYFSTMLSGSDYPTVPELCVDPGDNGYIMQMIRTEPYDYANYTDEDFYEYGKKSLYYIFSNNQGEVFYEADSDYADYYKNKEIHVVPVADAPTFLEGIFAKYGLDASSAQAPEVAWKELEY